LQRGSPPISAFVTIASIEKFGRKTAFFSSLLEERAMSKKTKVKKAKAAGLKPRKAKASVSAVTPTYLPEGQTYTMGLHDIVRVLSVIEKHGHKAKFVKEAKRQEAAGTFDAKTVNFVKDFMVKHKMHTDPIGKHIVNARRTGPAVAGARGRFNCRFS
jgi:hypothetical protein